MLKNVLGVGLGLFIGLVMLGFIEFTGQLVFAPTEGVDINDPAAMKELQANQPVPKLVVLLAAWSLGALAGGWVCCELAGAQRIKAALVVGLLLQLISIRVLMKVPHPLWFVIATQVVILPSAYGGTRITLFIENWYRSKRS